MKRDVVSVVMEVGLALRSLGRDMTVSLGVDDDLYDAVQCLPNSKVRRWVTMRGGKSLVLQEARAPIGRVIMQAMARERAATSAEVEAAGPWTEHDAGLQTARLRRGT